MATAPKTCLFPRCRPLPFPSQAPPDSHPTRPPPAPAVAVKMLAGGEKKVDVQEEAHQRAIIRQLEKVGGRLVLGFGFKRLGATVAEGRTHRARAALEQQPWPQSRRRPAAR